MKKRILTITICLLACLAIASSCGRNKAAVQKEKYIVAALRGPSSVAMIRLIDSLATCSNPSVEVQIFDEPLQLRKMMLEGTADFAVLPTTMAALLYNKGLDYRVAAIPLWGSFYLCGNDESVRSLADLKGKKVFLMAKGMTPDIMFRHLLVKSGLEPYRDVDLDYRFPTHTDLANAAIAGCAQMCVLTEPYLSQVLNGNPDLHVLLDLNRIWEDVENQPEAETAFLCRGVLADSCSRVILNLVDAYRASAEWVKDYPDSAAVLSATYNINPDTLALMQSVSRTNINVVGAAEAEHNIFDYLEVFSGMSPESIGGKLPDEKFIVK